MLLLQLDSSLLFTPAHYLLTTIYRLNYPISCNSRRANIFYKPVQKLSNRLISDLIVEKCAKHLGAPGIGCKAGPVKSRSMKMTGALVLHFLWIRRMKRHCNLQSRMEDAIQQIITIGVFMTSPCKLEKARASKVSGRPSR